jgi:hypothetical protein
MQFIKTESFSLKASPSHSEKDVHTLLASQPSLLGLGDIEHIDTEIKQNNGGRLDLMFEDEAGDRRYCVEVQLGATDETHIIRTLEYWDNQRSRNPHIDHVAVIVAEDITTRFLNVIALFNKSVPLIAIQLSAFKVNGEVGVTTVKILDLAQNMGWDEDNTSSKILTDRPWWEKKASVQTVKFADKFLEVVQSVTSDDSLELKFNKHYIGLARHGVADNFMAFKPRKKAMLVEFKMPFSQELQDRIEDSLDFVSYNSRWGAWIVRFTEKDLTDNRTFVEELVALARKGKNGTNGGI